MLRKSKMPLTLFGFAMLAISSEAGAGTATLAGYGGIINDAFSLVRGLSHRECKVRAIGGFLPAI